MKRREFITLLGGAAAAWPLAAWAQSNSKVWHIGMLETVSATSNASNFGAFRNALRSLGYVEGQNLTIDYRSADGKGERFPELAAALVRAKVDIIVTRGTLAVLAVKKATSTIPVVMAASGEPVTAGIVASLARPGANITGLSAFTNELIPKRIELLTETVPRIRRIAFLQNMANPVSQSQWNELKAAAQSAHIEALLLDVRNSEGLPRAFETAVSQQINALLVGNDTITQANRQQITGLAIQYRLPTMYAAREFVDAGGLMVYGVNYPDLYRRAATYVDKIFKGSKPSELPVEQPTKFDLVINLKAAKALGITMPPSLLALADKVIE
jgi:putative ABC transport system substrate-binding protein